MKLSVINFPECFEIAHDLAQRDDIAIGLAADIILRKMSDDPPDSAYWITRNKADNQLAKSLAFNIIDKIPEELKETEIVYYGKLTESLPLHWKIVEPLPGLTGWKERWTPQKDNVRRIRYDEIDAMVAQGIPRQKALGLYNYYGGLEGLIENLKVIKPKKYQELIFNAWKDHEAREQGKHKPILWEIPRKVDNVPYFASFLELSCNNLLRAARNVSRVGYKIVTTKEDLDLMVEDLLRSDLIAFDTETSSTDSLTCDVAGFSFSGVEGGAYYVSVGHTGGPNLDLAETVRTIQPIFSSDIKLVAHNLKYDYIVSKRAGLDLNHTNFYMDTMVAAWMVRSKMGERKDESLGLKPLTYRLLGVKMTQIEDLIGKGKKQIAFNEVPVNEAGMYSAADSDYTRRLVYKLERALKEEDVWKPFIDIEMPLIPILAEMEMYGVPFDLDIILNNKDSVDKLLQDELEGLEKAIYFIAGEEFNINSPAQLSKILYNKLKIPMLQGASTKKEVLEKIRDQHYIIDYIIEYRTSSKLKSAFTESLPKRIRGDGRLHGQFNQTRAETTRLSSSEPNLQQIPARSKVGKRIREAFVAEPGYLLISRDYKQQELRILAQMSFDTELIKMLKDSSVDIYQNFAARMDGIANVDDVPKARRDFIKAFILGLGYGLTPEGAAYRLNITMTQANDIFDTFFAKFPGIAQFMKDIVIFAKKNGYTKAIAGHKRWYPNINKLSPLAKGSERQAMNMPMQGSGAEITKLAIIALDRAIKEFGIDSHLVLTIHDEIVYHCKYEDMLIMNFLLDTIMPYVVKLVVPLSIDGSLGASNWAALK